jgi:hypothetical protein
MRRDSSKKVMTLDVHSLVIDNSMLRQRFHPVRVIEAIRRGGK